MDNNLDTFVDSLITEKHLPGLTEEGRKYVFDELKSSLIDHINRAVLNALPEDKLDELDSLMDREDTTPETLQAFISNSHVDVARITAETILYFRSLYLEAA